MLVRARCKQCGGQLGPGQKVTPVCTPVTLGGVMAAGKLEVMALVAGVICEDCRKAVMSAALREMRRKR